MKQTLIALLLLAAIAGRAQNVFLDTGSLKMVTMPFFGFPGEQLPPIDTLKVFFLATDTAQPFRIFRGFSLKTGWLINDTALYPYRYDLRVIPGYIPRVKKADQWNEYFSMEPVVNLDADKKPLSQNFIIWQTLPRK